MSAIENTYQTFFKKHAINKQSKFLIAVSGGVDSMTALAIAKEQGLNVCAAHVNYSLRAKESEKETALVQKYCNKHKINCFIIHENAENYANKHQLSIQEAAREIRYCFFDKLIFEHHFDYVVTAHQKEDNIETFFLNAIRGSGTTGLSGIPTKRKNYIRPFLLTPKKEMITYAKQNNIPYLNDSSNLDSKYDRNFIRNNITPLLEKRFPNFLAGMELTLENISSENQLLKSLINEHLAPFLEHKNDVIYITPPEHLELEIWYQFLKPYGFNHSQVCSLVNKEHQTGKKFISSSYELFIDRGKWIVQKKQVYNDQLYFINENLSCNAPFNLKAVKTTIPDSFSKNNNSAYLDIDKLVFPLKIRRWEKGDFFTPIGMKNKKKISDFLIDEKIPLNQKENTWIVESDNEIIWVVKHRISEQYKITSTSKCCLILKA